MNKKSLISLTAGIFTLFACSDSVVETDGGNPIQTKAKLTVVLTDAVNGEVLSGAGYSVQLTSEAKPKAATVNAAKSYIFKDVYVGQHTLLISAPAPYAARTATTSIDPTNSTNVSIAVDKTVPVTLYPETAGLKGQVFYANKYGPTVAAPGVEVQLHFTGSTCPLVKKVYTAENSSKTLADGWYEFKGLPAINNGAEGCAARLVTLGTEIEGIPFQTTQWTNTINLGTGAEDIATATVTLSRDYHNTSSFVVKSIPASIAETAVGEPIEIVFSENINKERLTGSSIASLYNISYSTSEIAQVTWGTNSVTLTPAGKWQETFIVNFPSLFSEQGKQLDGSEYYTIIVQKKDISGATVLPKVDNHAELIGEYVVANMLKAGKTIDSVKQTDTYIQLSWRSVPGAEEGYEVYCRKATEKNFTSCGSTGTETDTVVTVYGLNFAKDSISFLVQGKNSQYTTILANENALVVRDNISLAKFVGYNREYYTDNDLARPFAENISLGMLDELDEVEYIEDQCVSFGEPMDMKSADLSELSIVNVPKGNGTSGAIAKVSIDAAEWRTNNQTLCFDFKIAKPAMSSALDAKIAISGLKDVNGNPLWVKFRDTGVSPAVVIDSTNVLEIRLTATAAP